MDIFFFRKLPDSRNLAQSFITVGLILGVLGNFFSLKYDIILFIIAIIFFIIGLVILYRHVQAHGFITSYKKEDLRKFIKNIVVGSCLFFAYILWKFNLLEKMVW